MCKVIFTAFLTQSKHPTDSAIKMTLFIKNYCRKNEGTFSGMIKIEFLFNEAKNSTKILI